jgi:hypothetical protein
LRAAPPYAPSTCVLPPHARTQRFKHRRRRARRDLRACARLPQAPRRTRI